MRLLINLRLGIPYYLFLLILLSIGNSKAQNKNERSDSCLLSFPSIIINPSPLYHGSSDIFGFKSKVDLDSCVLTFFDTGGVQIQTIKKYGIGKNEHVDLSNYLGHLLKPKDLQMVETKVPIIWLVEYWPAGINGKSECGGLVLFHLYN